VAQNDGEVRWNSSFDLIELCMAKATDGDFYENFFWAWSRNG
jgi:hypothetical protein